MSLKSELIDFVYFMYRRGRIMITLMERINNYYPVHKFLKYTLSYLEVGYFKSSNQEMRRYLEKNIIRLPSGAEFDILSFSERLQGNLRAEILGFLEDVQKDESEFNKLLSQLHPRLTSAQYKKEFERIYEKYPDIFTALEIQMTQGEVQSEEFFSYYFERFFKQECLLDYRKQSE
jgi:hypothetical protein